MTSGCTRFSITSTTRIKSMQLTYGKIYVNGYRKNQHHTSYSGRLRKFKNFQILIMLAPTMAQFI